MRGGKSALSENIKKMVGAYEAERQRFEESAPTFSSSAAREKFVDEFVTKDATKISWSRGLKGSLAKKQALEFDAGRIVPTAYRPFTRQWLYFDRQLNEMVNRIPRMFPVGASEQSQTDTDKLNNSRNRVICVSAKGGKVAFSALMVDAVPSLHMVDIDGSHCLPRWLLDTGANGSDEGLFDSKPGSIPRLIRHDAISDVGLNHFLQAYPEVRITKDDLFHYVYGLLHSEDYRARYADNLSKQLPRLPLPRKIEDFHAFVAAGRALGELHVGYETVEPYPVTIKEGDLRLADIPEPVIFYRVEQMKFAGKRPNLDKTTVIYNPRITITGIPLEAYDYVVNGKPALEWVMERQAVRTDKDSGIVNDANRWANETAGDPAYPFKLFCRIITVSLETQKIVKGLPTLDIQEPLPQ